MYCVCAWMNGKKQKQMTDLNQTYLITSVGILIALN